MAFNGLAIAAWFSIAAWLITPARADDCGSVFAGASKNGYSGPYGGYDADGRCHVRDVSRGQCDAIGGQFSPDRGANYTRCSFSEPRGGGFEQGNVQSDEKARQFETWRRVMRDQVALMKKYAAALDWNSAAATARYGAKMARETMGDDARAIEFDAQASKYEGHLIRVNANTSLRAIDDFGNSRTRAPIFAYEVTRLREIVSHYRNAGDVDEAVAAEELSEKGEEIARDLKALMLRERQAQIDAESAQDCAAKGGVRVEDLLDWYDDYAHYMESEEWSPPRLKIRTICTVKPISEAEVKAAAGEFAASLRDPEN